MLNLGPCPPVSAQVQARYSICYCCGPWCDDSSRWPAMGRPWVCLTFLTLLLDRKGAVRGRTSFNKVPDDLGELSPAASDLQEWIVEQYRRKCSADKSRADGCSTSDLVRQFRHKFKLDIQFAIAAGLGAMIQAAGQPWGDLGSA